MGEWAINTEARKFMFEKYQEMKDQYELDKKMLWYLAKLVNDSGIKTINSKCRSCGEKEQLHTTANWVTIHLAKCGVDAFPALRDYQKQQKKVSGMRSYRNQKYRKEIRKKEPFKTKGLYCTGCEAKEGRIELHHTRPVLTFPKIEEAYALSNLKLLCPACHKEAERCHEHFTTDIEDLNAWLDW